jgi:hypothetical protein
MMGVPTVTTASSPPPPPSFVTARTTRTPPAIAAPIRIHFNAPLRDVPAAALDDLAYCTFEAGEAVRNALTDALSVRGGVTGSADGASVVFGSGPAGSPEGVVRSSTATWSAGLTP